MRAPRILRCLIPPALLVLSGCGYVHVGRLPTSVASGTAMVPDEKLAKENTDLRLEKKMLQQELALTRAQGDALRMAIENRAADGDTSARLVEKLNQTSRELASLRANYAQLQTERNQAVASAGEATALRTRLGATEEKLAESLRTYTELQGEVTRLRTDVDHTRAENVALGEQVKSVTAQNAEAQAALAQLNTELLSQKNARVQAEQDAATLRTELASVAPNASALAQQRTGAAAAASSLVAEHAAETAALKEQLGVLRAKLDTLSAERTGLQQQLAGVENAARASAPEPEAKAGVNASPAQSLRDQLRDAQAQAATLMDENTRLKARLPSSSGTAATSNATPTVSGPRPVIHLNDPAAPGVNATLVMNVPNGGRSSIVRNTDTNGQGQHFHVVAGGDTLAKISNQYYGTPGRWGEILAANRDVLGETNNLVVGRTLRIP